MCRFPGRCDPTARGPNGPRKGIQAAMKDSLQEIADAYGRAGLCGQRLRTALAKDSRYQQLLRARKQKLTKQFRVPPWERAHYVLATDEDFAILAKLRSLERLPLSAEDRRLVRFIRSQLILEWRKPVLRTLDRLLTKYARPGAFGKLKRLPLDGLRDKRDRAV